MQLYNLPFAADNIARFMAYYRSQFPTATVTPKLHMLEEHVVPWIKRWGMGFGLLGEQGAESIHAYFNSLKRTYSGIPDGLQRLKQMMVEHHLHVAPANTTARPPVVKKKKLSDVAEE